MDNKHKVVVIEDEKDLALLIKTILEGTAFFEVSVAHNGLDGIQLVKDIKPELVFLDYVMPKANGDKVIAELRKDPATNKIPLVLMSGLGEMVYLKKKDQWRWMPNTPEALNRGDVPEVLSDRNTASETAKALGVNDFLQKPFRKDSLISISKRLLKIELESPLRPEPS